MFDAGFTPDGSIESSTDPREAQSPSLEAAGSPASLVPLPLPLPNVGGGGGLSQHMKVCQLHSQAGVAFRSELLDELLCGAYTRTGTCCRPYPAQTLALRCHPKSACVHFWQALPRRPISSRSWAQHPQASCCTSKTRRPMQHWAWRCCPARWDVMQIASHAAAIVAHHCHQHVSGAWRCS